MDNLRSASLDDFFPEEADPGLGAGDDRSLRSRDLHCSRLSASFLASSSNLRTSSDLNFSCI